MKVVVYGGCGYIGACLVPLLLADGHEVEVVDKQWFGNGALPDNHKLKPIDPPADAAIDLSGLTNNDMCNLNPCLDERANRRHPQAFAKLYEVKSLIFASSVAAYGSSDAYASETTPLRPTTLYGASKAFAESVMPERATIVRLASVVGYSPNQRLDTTMNKMTHDAMRHGVIRVNGGEQVRTHVSIKDACDFFRLCLSLPHEITRGQVYNLVDKNVTVMHSARMVAEACNVALETYKATDNRSYRVDGVKAFDLGWKPLHGIENAIIDMKVRFDAGYWKDSLVNPWYQRMRYDLI